MGVIKELFNKCVNYAKANPVHAIVLAAIAALILIVLVIIVVRLIKRSRAKKRLKKQAQQQATPTPVKPATTSQVTKPAPTKEEEEAKKAAAEEARRAVFERLEQQRLEAEREEAGLKAKEEAEKKAKEDAEKKVAEEVAVAEKKKSAPKTTKTAKPAEKKPTKKATPAKKAEEPKPEQQPAPVLYDEMKDAHEEDKVWYDENETDKAAKYSGKWLICRVLTDDAHEEEEMYFFELHASNGEKLLSSEEYTSYAGALRGIETHKANILKGNFKVTISKKGDYIFKLLSGKNLLLCMGENYPTRARCESAIESAKRFAQTAVIDENVVDHIVKVPVEDDGEIQALPEGYNGKWIINAREGADGENIYYFELFANNGEKLLSSEDYTSYVGAVNGIQTHKTNIEKGNFRITLTKRGDYIYKLLNANGQLLCLGEHYKTKRLCQNAVESVKRFAMNSPVLADSSLTR